MASLHEHGWRQGSIFTAMLPHDGVILGSEGKFKRDLQEHGRWLVATQDCDLDHAETDDPNPMIELRAVFDHDPPQDWGIRSSRLRLTDDEYLISHGPRTVVSAALLFALQECGCDRIEPSHTRRLVLARWLGLRYNRPAVPNDLAPLARRIAEEVAIKRRRPTGLVLRDILMQFDESQSPPQFSLYAILEDTIDEERVHKWLSDIALSIPQSLGSPQELRAATTAGISIELLERSYAADVTSLTYRRGQPEPEGAT